MQEKRNAAPQQKTKEPIQQKPKDEVERLMEMFAKL